MQQPSYRYLCLLASWWIWVGPRWLFTRSKGVNWLPVAYMSYVKEAFMTCVVFCSHMAVLPLDSLLMCKSVLTWDGNKQDMEAALCQHQKFLLLVIVSLTGIQFGRLTLVFGPIDCQISKTCKLKHSVCVLLLTHNKVMKCKRLLEAMSGPDLQSRGHQLWIEEVTLWTSIEPLLLFIR